MADHQEPTQCGDDELRRFQQRQILEFALAADAWAARANETRRQLKAEEAKKEPEPFTFSRPLSSLLGEPTQREQRARLESAAVWDLAVVCRNFIIGDVWGWGHCLRRKGLPVDKIEELVQVRRADVTSQTLEQKWRPYLTLASMNWVTFGTTWSEPLDRMEWIQGTWNDAVEEDVEDFITSVLMPQLAKQSALVGEIVSTPPEPANQKRVVDFMQRICVEVGERVWKIDLARAAGYETRTELQDFQRNDPTLGDKAKMTFEQLLAMEPAEVWRIIERKRKTRSNLSAELTSQPSS
jgi:hypothetical protein